MYENILKKEWFSINKKPKTVTDIIEAAEDNTVIHIGSDAQAFGKKLHIVTCVVVHRPGKGGLVFYHKERNVRSTNLWDKLYAETMLSLSCAAELTDINPELRDRILVHVDANPQKVHASSCYVQQLAGMVCGYGFKYVIKPDAWCSSHCADHIVKGKNHG